MADTDTEVQDTPEDVAEARKLGWVPKEEFRGTAGKEYVDAKTFLDKGRAILPHVQRHNDILKEELAATRRLAEETAEALKGANAAIDALQESHDADVKAQVEAAKEELTAQLAAANEAGDHRGAADITRKMVELNKAEDSADAGGKAKPTEKTPPNQVTMHPEVRAWIDSNQEFLADPDHTALMNSITLRMRSKGDTRVGKAFMDDARQQVETRLNGGQRRQDDGRVEGGNGGGARNDTDGKTFADLPADVKATCDRLGAKVIGPGRAHKDQASWRKSYVSQYFKE